jgi:hypothetical protein
MSRTGLRCNFGSHVQAELIELKVQVSCLRCLEGRCHRVGVAALAELTTRARSTLSLGVVVLESPASTILKTTKQS